MRTVAFAHNTFVRFGCDLCGGTIDKIGVSGQLLADDGERIADDICPACTEAGPHGAAVRMRRFAASIRQQAEALEEIADEVENITDWATLEDWGRARLKLNADFRDVEETEVSAWIEEHLPGWVENIREAARRSLQSDADNGPESGLASVAVFLPVLWKGANGDRQAMAELLKANALLGKYFTIDSPEVQAVMAGEA